MERCHQKTREFAVQIKGMLHFFLGHGRIWIISRDNFLILQVILASLVYLSFPSLASLPVWNTRGVLCCLILHIGISEPLFYWMQRLLHSPAVFQRYHWLHHSSKINHPFTAGHTTFLEQLLLCIVVGISTLGTAFLGYGSITMIYQVLMVSSKSGEV